MNMQRNKKKPLSISKTIQYEVANQIFLSMEL